MLLLGLGYHIIIIIVDDMIIINVDYIRRRMEGQAIPPWLFVPLESPRIRVSGIVSLDEPA